jgi:hypothetical protein
VRRGERSLTDIARSARRVAAAGLRQTFDRAGAGARRLIRNLRDLERRLRLAERAGFATGRALRKLGGMAGGLLKSGLFAGGAAVAAGGSFALFDMFRTAGQFEQYQAMLEGAEGSVEAARKSMAWVAKFAEKTPYELAEVMEAFIALKAYGIDPMNGSLEALGDASAGMSKPLMQAVEAIADASTGEFERLKEFGIRASKEGNRVAFTFRKNGQDIRRDAEFTGSEIEKTLVGIFNERFAGGMVRQSTTLFGIIANIKDKWSEFLRLIAEAGIFDMVKADLQALLEKVNQMAKDGSLKRWAEDISDRLEKAWKFARDFIENTDWNKVADEVRRTAEAIGVLVDAILAAKDAAAWLNVGSGADEFISSIPDRIKGLRGSLVPAPKPAAPGSAPTRLPGDNDLVRRALGKQSSLQVGGKLEIGITAPPGYSAKPTAISTSNPLVPIEVRTGRTMRGSA